MTPALGNFFAQIRQPNTCTVARNQILLSVLAGTSAFLAREAHHVSGVFAELEPAGHKSLFL
jgi:hypothetical protein